MEHEADINYAGILWRAMAVIVVLLLVFVLTNKKLASQNGLFSVSALSFIVLGLLVFCLGMSAKHMGVKMALFCLMSVFSAITVVEVYLNAQSLSVAAQYDAMKAASAQGTFNTTDGMVVDMDDVRGFFLERGRTTEPDAVNALKMTQYHEKLGYRLREDIKEVLAVKVQGDETVYVAAYHLKPDGWRITPKAPEAKRAAVFMGDSFTFGIGVDDEDTYPYKVGNMLGGIYQSYNYGVGGWGTHQVLAMVEDGWLDEVFAQYGIVHVFYMPIDDHKNRIAGASPWDEDGPCYELQEDNTLTYSGSFKKAKEQQQHMVLLFSKLNEVSYREYVMKMMIKQIDRLLLEKYGVRLTLVIPYDDCKYLYELETEGIEILDAMTPHEGYSIPIDGHPNSKATEVFAQKIVDYIHEADQQ